MGDIGRETDIGELERVVPEEAPAFEPEQMPATEPAREPAKVPQHA